MLPSVIMLILASILGSIVRLDLHTGTYLAGILGNTIPALPCSLHVLCCCHNYSISHGHLMGHYSPSSSHGNTNNNNFCTCQSSDYSIVSATIISRLGGDFFGGYMRRPAFAYLSNISYGLNEFGYRSHYSCQNTNSLCNSSNYCGYLSPLSSVDFVQSSVSLLTNCLISLAIGMALSFVLLITTNMVARRWRLEH